MCGPGEHLVEERVVAERLGMVALERLPVGQRVRALRLPVVEQPRRLHEPVHGAGRAAVESLAEGVRLGVAVAVDAGEVDELRRDWLRRRLRGRRRVAVLWLLHRHRRRRLR